MLVQRCLQIVPDPASADLQSQTAKANVKDLRILVAALREGCPWLVTFNVRDYEPGDPAVSVLSPGDFVREIRHLLGRLG